MRILIVNQFYWPDVAATGQLLVDLTRHLSSEHHEVTVICGGGSYAQSDSADDRPPVSIIRIPGFRYKRGPLSRLFSYSSFFLGSLWHELRMPRQDIILTMTTPPLLAVGGALLKALRGTRHYVWEMDVFPDAFVTLGALAEGSWITRALTYVENSCRAHSDGVITLGPCMKKRLMDRGVPAELVHVAENWADSRLISPGRYRKDGPLDVLYSGNLGLAHDVETISDAMRHFRNDARFLFTFAGSGCARADLERACREEGISNARFLSYFSRERLSEHLGNADLGLVTEQAAHIGVVVPSKVYGLMAAGRPILFIGPRGSTVDSLIRRFGCGWQISPGDVNSLIGLLEWISTNRAAVEQCGKAGRKAFEEHYDVPQGVARVSAALQLTPSRSEAPTRLRQAATNVS